MLEHLQDAGTPSRVVVLGANGFVGRALCQRLKQEAVNVLELTRQQVDLLNPDATEQLLKQLQASDTLVITAAEASCKNAAMLYRNVRMMNVVCEVLQKQAIQQVIYISSDAVYADSDQPLTETSVTAPTSLHGVMHLAREMMLQSVCSENNISLAILRPSLLYGAEDPHNGYGPNRFRRLADNHESIILFGEGEEQRDHVYIDDVAEIITRVIQRCSRGVLNIATGQVISFKQLAEKVVQLSNNEVAIQPSPRQGSMPHNGYRPFDITDCQKAFPDFSYTSIEDGLQYSQLKMKVFKKEVL
ncbi:NAD-dependent epimerase/dehydratase family protein [Coxiella burnetii]|uniref:UDP-glucose-4-epimerase n=2 Tax=Coxiella burnetii TaxID=777 RepID=Q93N62_COXBE|nr:NAD-dependent epimerase/dehydratase [Coxiella burnetii]AAK71260.1 UDP-glucose-4-epimerase [Coxiella burnetii]ABX79070.1 NAD-dependent epimerase/dehydratase family protein [Coxiella burnetii RSA 331]ATN81846.1 NAD-dependent dehydratase [Coxiella burnetii]ATN83750.1 NAD-dependent dehydratase [Coxiella burnetii]POZ79417.1 NAD-dependent dehydratase [Coxiella burnetii]